MNPRSYTRTMNGRDDFDAALKDRIDELVEASAREGDAPGVVAGIARDEAVHVAVAGEATIGGAPMRRDTVFRLSSNAKTMTAAVVLSMVEDGLLGLDDLVEGTLPELADRRVLRDPAGPLDDTVPARRPITVRDLLTFTWGFGSQGAMFEGTWPIVEAANERELQTFGPPQPAAAPDPDTWIARLGELPLIAQPGERWLYHSGSQVLGVLASRVAGAPFEAVMRERVLVPLGMGDTGFHCADPERLPTAYWKPAGERVVYDEPDGQWVRPPEFADGGAGLVSTIDDVLAFGRALLRDDGILSPVSVAEMTRDQLTAEQRADVWPGFDLLSGRGWGYGVSVLEDGSYTWDGGLGTTWINVPGQGLTIAVLTQRAADETGFPAVHGEVIKAARELA